MMIRLMVTRGSRHWWIEFARGRDVETETEPTEDKVAYSQAERAGEYAEDRAELDSRNRGRVGFDCG